MIRVVKPDGSTYEIYEEFSRVSRDTNRVWSMEFSIARTQEDGFTLQEQSDEIELVSDGSVVFRGVLRDIDRTQTTKIICIVDSFERYAMNAEPTGGLVEFQNVDDTVVIEDAISRVSALSAGTIENVQSGLTVQFNYVSPARMMRTVRDITGADLRFNADKTVDYVADIGSDRSGSVTLSPSNQNIEELRVNRLGGQKRANHLRVLGGGGGAAQVVVDVVADSFDSSTDSEIWDTVSNKDITNSDALRSFGKNIVNERDQKHFRGTAVVRDVEISLGDVVSVEYPEKNISTSLKAIEVERIRDSAGQRDRVKFSTLDLFSYKRQDKVSQDVERFNRTEGQKVIATFDDPTIAPQREGNIIYVTGNDSNYPRDVYYHNGSSFEATQRGDVDADVVSVDLALVVPTGTDAQDGAVLPVGQDRYDTT